MSLLTPKIIDLNTSVALTGEKILIFLTKDEFSLTKEKVLNKIKDSFKEHINSDLQFKVDVNTLSLTVIPTTDCNLRCIYCYSDGGFDKVYLDLNFAKEFIDKMLLENKDCNKINLNFAGGGEPLLNFNLINDLVHYLKAKGIILNLSMVTNGILVPEYLSWLKANNVFLRVSYDGSAQETNRPGIDFNSKQKLEETFKLLKANYSPELLGVQMTITKSNVATLADDVRIIINNYGINTIKIESVHTSCSKRAKIVQQPTPNEFVNAYLQVLDSLVKDDVVAYIDSSYLSIPSTAYFCSLRNKAVISPYNVISSCVEVIKKGIKDEIILSDNLSNLNFKDIKEKQLNYLYIYHPKNYEECSNCNLSHICKSNCPMRKILNNNIKYDFNCVVSKLLIPKFLERASNNEKYLQLVFGDSFNEEHICD